MKVDRLEYTNSDAWLDIITVECGDYPLSEIEVTDDFVVVDAGANVGGFVMSWGSKFPKIYSIEASKNNFDRLIENTKQYEDKVSYHNLAVGKNSGETLKLMHYTHTDGEKTNSGNFGVVNYVNKENNHGWKEETGYEEVESISLEDVLKLVGGKIDVLKIDVEGSEYDFLYDKDLTNINYITMELHNFLYHDGRQQRLIDHILKTHDETHSIGGGVDCHYLKTWKRK
jgi:FkbM family methyltransferase